MIDTLKTLSMMILIGVAVRFFSEWLGSPYLMKFLDANLINLQIALLAINTTTAGVVLSRMREIMDSKGVNFNSTIRSFRNSAYEQLFLIFSSIFLLIVINSPLLSSYTPQVKPVLECLITSVFLASLYNLYDNAKSIFIIISFKI